MNIIEVFERFPTQDDCLAHLESVRWGDKALCPYCGSDHTTPLKKQKKTHNHRHHCNNCNTSFSVTVDTIFHHTRLPLQKWFLAVALTLNAKKGLSARQLARHIKCNKDTAWRIAMKIREAMNEAQQRTLLTGLVEADECYLGGKPRKGKPGDKPKRGRGTKKTPVVGMIERGGRVVTKAITDRKLTSKRITELVRRHVDIGSATLITDEFKGYIGIAKIMPHETVNHQVWYVDGSKHTNSIESFWAILKRGLIGQYHKVSIRHLPAYLNEFSYRFNRRKCDASEVFELTIARGLGIV